LGELINLAELEQLVQAFFLAQREAGRSVVIALDGKTVRGTITGVHPHGLHLLAAYLPAEGWVLLQMEVGGKGNEITVAPRLLRCLDLRGKVVTGDALLAQRALSIQIVQAGGDYLWTVKSNQARLRREIERLFAPRPAGRSFNPLAPDGLRTAQRVDQGHGRREWRTLTVTRLYRGIVHWPAAAQAFKLERRFVQLTTGQVSEEVVYGVTSLTAAEASAERLLEWQRSHWGIENGLHYRRDETFGEDRYQLKTGHTAHAMALLNNLVLGLILRQGYHNVPRARRYYDAHPQAALKLVLNNSG
jgi:predicted transposase YbfD/YdcC